MCVHIYVHQGEKTELIIGIWIRGDNEFQCEKVRIFLECHHSLIQNTYDWLLWDVLWCYVEKHSLILHSRPYVALPIMMGKYLINSRKTAVICQQWSRDSVIIEGSQLFSLTFLNLDLLCCIIRGVILGILQNECLWSSMWIKHVLERKHYVAGSSFLRKPLICKSVFKELSFSDKVSVLTRKQLGIWKQARWLVLNTFKAKPIL